MISCNLCAKDTEVTDMRSKDADGLVALRYPRKVQGVMERTIQPVSLSAFLRRSQLEGKTVDELDVALAFLCREELLHSRL